MDWLDLLAIQRTLKSLLQHHNSKASILQRSAFFIIQVYLYHLEIKKKNLEQIKFCVSLKNIKVIKYT